MKFSLMFYNKDSTIQSLMPLSFMCSGHKFTGLHPMPVSCALTGLMGCDSPIHRATPYAGILRPFRAFPFNLVSLAYFGKIR